MFLANLLHSAYLQAAGFDWTPWIELIFAIGVAGIAIIIINSRRSEAPK